MIIFNDNACNFYLYSILNFEFYLCLVKFAENLWEDLIRLELVFISVKLPCALILADVSFYVAANMKFADTASTDD